MGLRYYLWPDTDPPMRLPTAFLSGKKRYPQFAGSRQRYIEAQIDSTQIIWRVIGSYIDFDAEGGLDDSRLADQGWAMVKLHDAKSRPVADLDAVRELSAEVAAIRWEPTAADLDKLRNDISGKERIPFAKPAEKT